MQKYGLIGQFKAKKGEGHQLTQILIEAAHLMAGAKGCVLYVVGNPENQPDTVQIVEVWNSKEEHDDSLNYPGVKDLIARAMPLFDGPPEKGLVVDVKGGHGLER